MKNYKKIIAVTCLMFSGHISAATVTWGSSASVYVNDTFTLDIVGNNFASNVDGGGVSFSYNANVLNVLSVSIDENVWDLGAGILSGTINNSLGTVDGIAVNAWSDVTGDFTVASVTFQAIGLGASGLSLSEWLINPWGSGGSLIGPDYVGGSVTVSTVPVSAVPVPAAVWLFGSGLVGLAGFARRKA